jgi:hypothetical protein
MLVVSGENEAFTKPGSLMAPPSSLDGAVTYTRPIGPTTHQLVVVLDQKAFQISGATWNKGDRRGAV